MLLLVRRRSTATHLIRDPRGSAGLPPDSTPLSGPGRRTSCTIHEATGWLACAVPAFARPALPALHRQGRRRTVRPWMVRSYLRLKPVWPLLGRQMMVVVGPLRD